MDAVLELVNADPDSSQSAVVDRFGDTARFIALHGDHRDPVSGGAARSRLKSIKDELSVVKTWTRADRVPGVSFEAHKLVIKLGVAEGGALLHDLALELGGSANVTKSAIKARLSALRTDSGSVGAPSGTDPVVITEHGEAEVGEHEVTGDPTGNGEEDDPAAFLASMWDSRYPVD